MHPGSAWNGIFIIFSFPMKFIDLVEILGTAAFAFAGAASAMKKRLDVFGVLIITFVTAIGGGTIRDLLIGSLPVAWIHDLQIISCIMVAYLISLFFTDYVQRFPRIIFWLDTIGLAVFCMVAIRKGIAFDLHPIVCIALGTITGCFGGIIRDVLLNEIPYVFRKDIYASACIAAGIIYYLSLIAGAHEPTAGLIAGGIIIVIRYGATYWNWRLPLIYSKEPLS
jgi:uncharacterized membrane protein YeiH